MSPDDWIASNDLAFAISDGFPVAPGHSLVITRRLVSTWFDATAEEQAALMELVNVVKQKLDETLRPQPDGYNVGFNAGSAAGQTVDHVHIHVIPRYVGDMDDPRGGVRHVIPGKGNYLKAPAAGVDLLQGKSKESLLIRGSEDPFLPHMRLCIDKSIRVDFAVAFILKSGVGLIREHLRDLMDRGGQVRIVTGDYLDATDPDALVELLDLGDDLQLRVFEATNTSFHPKAYIFYDGEDQGTAFVGSSNLTMPALRGGVEWNYRVLRADADRGFAEVANAFGDLFTHPMTRVVDPDWIDSYRSRRVEVTTRRVVEVVEESPEPPPKPHAIQEEALAALSATRRAGNEAGLVVLATGLGKTWLAAFDSASDEFQNVLFVAHREEILTQAMQTFRRIRPQARLGFYTGKEKAPEADVLFASIQTLGRIQHLEQFERERFDYIIVDEFHHAAARTYRRLIDYFTPRFLLGLTATPERMDGGDLLALCQENLVYRKDLVAGIEAGLLCPFRYFGVPDEVDYANIPWRSSRFDEEALTNAVATNQRAENALEQYWERGGKRTLGFCCSQRHADFMADFFVQNGVRAVAVHSGARSAPRASALEALAEGELDILFAVDMFNEGLDMPNIDTVLMLRPTESSIIWLQQFGRGLRRAEGKKNLQVIDYIGNHRAFLLKVRSLLAPVFGTGGSDSEISAAMRLLQQGRADLPEGCEITYDLEAIDIIKSLLRIRPSDDAILAFYDDFRERHGTRPTAVELYHSGYNPRSVRKTHGSWTKFLRSMGDLDDGETNALESAGNFLDTLESTPMTKSFKMLTLLSMLNQDAMPGKIGIKELTAEFQRIARRSQTLRADVGDSLDDVSRLKTLIEKNPIEAWCGGKGTGGNAYFRYEDSQFSSEISVTESSRGQFQDLVREIVDWRLAEYLDRDHESAEPNQFVCRILQNKSGGAILKLPDRKKTSGIPSDWVEILANGNSYVANFKKEFINVIREDHSTDNNVLTEIVQEWFGPDAGRPGTRYEVRFEPAGDGLIMEPSSSYKHASTAETWRHYMREDIAPLFGLSFSTAIWNQGFVVAGGHVFLLVTLDKGGLNKDHRYEDHFLSEGRFQWQSQNRTKQDSKHGRIIKNAKAEGFEIHLFIRKLKVLDGKAAPFVYCGPVDFESWEGEKPISITWSLREPVPEELRSILDVPAKTKGSQ
ncbi:DUF3427 domain-containing protein [Rhodopirellula sp. ICT_H3.1]|uniref:DUF3427 domain-containing protein n=2 Tax=Aporhodopirellula aestuarii TaxID=2950107 RepID=A0ABT0U170_9BACT|nr:DUF3427 domain-containing protein [Aporhodopirellula aestuarii]